MNIEFVIRKEKLATKKKHQFNKLIGNKNDEYRQDNGKVKANKTKFINLNKTNKKQMNQQETILKQLI